MAEMAETDPEGRVRRTSWKGRVGKFPDFTFSWANMPDITDPQTERLIIAGVFILCPWVGR